MYNADYCLEFFGDDDEDNWEVVMLFCNKMERYYVPKCCKVNEILNIRLDEMPYAILNFIMKH